LAVDAPFTTAPFAALIRLPSLARILSNSAATATLGLGKQSIAPRRSASTDASAPASVRVENMITGIGRFSISSAR